MLVVGDKEIEQQTVTLRTLNGKQEFGLTVKELIQRAQKA
jgi:threonyl-tRNA synthetase